MKDAATPTMVLALVAMTAIFVRGTPAQPRESKAAENAQKSATEEDSSHSSSPDAAHRLLARHYGMTDLADLPGETAVQQIEAKAQRDRCGTGADESAPRTGIRVVVASVPDPVDSHLGSMFDAQLDALSRAARASGYALESWSFPWSRGESARQPPDLGQAAMGAGTEPESGSSERARQRTEPGAVLFTRECVPGEKERTLLFLLVGEAPTFGVHPAALLRAFELSTQLAPDQAITVVGPTFSGAASGLDRTLQAWSASTAKKPTPRRVDFLTGSATAREVPQILEDKSLSIEVTATRFTHDDETLDDAFRRFLEQRSDTPLRRAVLAERSTAYGAQLSNPGAGRPVPAGADSRAPPSAPLELSFPLLGPLRAATAQSEQAQGQKTRLESPLERTALGVAMESESAAVDVLPSYAGRQTANTVELELTNTIDALRRRDVRYAVIGATDPRDQLFLAQLLRRMVPQVHLVSFEGDVLYTHPSFSQDLLGMLVVSSYPLTAKLPRALQAWNAHEIAPGGRRWSRFDTQDTFPSGSSAGTYEAALVAIHGRKACVSGRPDASGLPCDWLESPRTPPVWVSAIGRDATWPIWVDRPTSGAKSEGPSTPLGKAALEPSVFFRAMVFLFSLLAGAHGLAYLLRLRPSAQSVQQGDKPGAFGSALLWLAVPGQTTESVWRRGGRCLLLVSLCLMTGVPSLSALALGPWSATSWFAALPELGRFPELFGFATALLVLAPASVDALACAFRPREQVRLSAVLVGLAGGVAALWRFGFLRGDWYEQTNRLLFGLRATHLESGLSPITPLFLIGCGSLLILWVSSRRAQLHERFAEVAPFPEHGLAADSSESLTPSIALLHSQLAFLAPLAQACPLRMRWNDPWPPRPSFVFALAALVVLPGALLFAKLSFAIDSTAWLYAFFFGIFALVGAVLLSLLRLLSVWGETRKLLRALTASPLRDAFGRLPARLGRTVGLEPSSAPALLGELKYPIDQLSLLSACLKKAKDEGKTPRFALEAAESHDLVHSLDRELKQAAKTHERLPSILSATQVKLTALVAGVWRSLSDAWMHPHASSGEGSGGPEPKLPADEDRPPDAVRRLRAGAQASERLQQDLAEEFVAGQITAFLSYIFVYLRTALLGTTAAVILLILALSTYPFEPQIPTLRFFMIPVGLVVALVWTILRQASRNELLSLLHGTTPHEVTWNSKLGLQLATYVGLPLLATLAAELPILSRVTSFLSGFVQR